MVAVRRSLRFEGMLSTWHTDKEWSFGVINRRTLGCDGSALQFVNKGDDVCG